MLDIRNQTSFDKLEKVYLYDIPETTVTQKEKCSLCGEEFAKDELGVIDGEYYCKECAHWLLEQNEIEREELENAF